MQTQCVQEGRQALQKGAVSKQCPEGRFGSERSQRTSMIHKMNTVKTNQNAPINTTAIHPNRPGMPSTPARVMFHSTSDNCA